MCVLTWAQARKDLFCNTRDFRAPLHGSPPPSLLITKVKGYLKAHSCLFTSTHQVSLPVPYECCLLRINHHHSPRPNSPPCPSETSSIPTKLVREQGRLSFIRSDCIVDVQAHRLLPPPLPWMRTMLTFPLLARFEYWIVCNVDGYCSPTFLYIMLHCGHATFL